jgi:flavin reductase (DIM6/NTAB) family NADH-FMN oxidoreductase RutF/DNA-binding IclR family transcriptional regulator
MSQPPVAQPPGPSVPSMVEFTAADFRRCLGEFVTGVTVITTVSPDGTPYGLTANSFSSVSLDPPLILWSLRLNATNFQIYSTAETFAVNILAEDQIEISNRFAKSGPGRFEGVAITRGGNGVPLIDGAVAQLECRREVSYPGGDHVVFIGRVLRVRNTDRKPLALRSGAYMIVHPHAPLQPSETDETNIATLKAVHAARPLVDELGRETNRSIGLAVWGNCGPTMIWWWEGTRPLRTQLRCGLVVSLLESATGSVFAAFAPSVVTAPFIDAELAAATKRGDRLRFSSRIEFAGWLEQVRKTGFAASYNLTDPGITDDPVNSVSAPVFNAEGEIVLAVTMMDNACAFGEADPVIERLMAVADKLSQRLGYGANRTSQRKSP